MADTQAWFDHYLAGAANGIETQPRVKLCSPTATARTTSPQFRARRWRDWPLPDTRWTALALGPGGTLTRRPRTRAATESYAQDPSATTNSDPYNTAIAGSAGLNALTTAQPVLSDMTVAGKLGRSYTTAALRRDVLSAGPGCARRAPVEHGAADEHLGGVWTCWPNGTPHPVAAGRLNSDFPDIDPSRSLRDPRTGAVVQPYGRYDRPRPATPGRARATA